jgi:hypothetical protein
MDHIILLIPWLFFSFVVASYSKNKMIGYWGGFLLSLILSPVAGLIITLLSKDCKSIFCLRFGKKMKEIRREEFKGNRDIALNKLMGIAKRLQRLIKHSENPEHYYLYKERVADKILELGGDIPDTWRESSI